MAQIERIKKKLVDAKEADKHFQVFGANRHKYFLNEPANLKEVTAFESKFSIELPDCYKSFILQVGNGGSGIGKSGAGPFYGIYPFGSEIDEFAYANIEKYLGRECIFKPGLTNNEWAKITERLEDDDITNDDFDHELGRVYSGLLPIGTQGCTYLHAIVLHGKYKGRVVNLDLDRNKPKFTFENNFLDWYERWLDEVIEGVLIESPSWFGYSMGGSDRKLLETFESTTDDYIKKEVLNGILRKRDLSRLSIDQFEQHYSEEKEASIKILLLNILTKFNSAKAKPLLIRLGADDLLSMLKIVFVYSKSTAHQWVEYLEANIDRIEDLETFNYAAKIMIGSKIDLGSFLNSFLKNEDEKIRSQAIFYLGNTPSKVQYLDLFINGLNDSSPIVIRSSLQALSGLRNRSLLKHYKYISENYSDDPYILQNLNFRLKEYNLDHVKIKKMNLDSAKSISLKGKEKKWYQIWK